MMATHRATVALLEVDARTGTVRDELDGKVLPAPKKLSDEVVATCGKLSPEAWGAGE